jgi:hypothetical protein
MTLKESAKFLIVVNFASLVKIDVLARNVGGVLFEPVVKPIKRSTFGDAWSSIKRRSRVVRKQNVPALTVDATIGGCTSLVFGALSSEGKIDGYALPRDGCFASGVGARRRLLQFGCKADGTRVENWVGQFKMRDTINMLVGSKEVRIT